VSFEQPEFTTDVTASGSLRILEALRYATWPVRFYQASSSEMFGKVVESPQSETTPFVPRSPYAVSKLFAHWMTVQYRDAYNVFAVNGILFNHESPRRGATFVTRKVTRGIASIIAGQEDKLYLGNLDARRDWGYAKEYVEAMWLMLQQPAGDDFVMATGVPATVREFIEAAFSRADLDWEKHVEIDPRYFRPTEVDALIGDPSKAEKQLGWKPTTHWRELAQLMVDADIAMLDDELSGRTVRVDR
jgi:GDPmannose 4,6-dehydratase